MAESPLRLKTLPEDLVKYDEIPLLGSLPPFPKQDFEKALADLFHFENVLLEHSPPEWVPFEKATEGVATPLITFTLTSAAVEGKLYFLVSKQEIESLMALILHTKTLDPDFKEDFAPFIAFSFLNAIKELSYPKNISFQCTLDETIEKDAYLCQNVTLKINDHPFSGRLLLSKTFQSSLKARYHNETTSQFPDDLNVTLSLEAGKANLTLAEWNAIQPGDWLILEGCSLEKDAVGGKVILTFQGKPLFRGKIKDGNLKILEHPLAYKED